MKVSMMIALFGTSLLACGSSQRADKLATALDSSDISLSDSVSRAEASDEQHLVATRAQLVVDGNPRFNVQARTTASAMKEIHLDSTGKILSASDLGASGPSCPGATSVKDAIGIAERASGGRAIQIQADDDDACLYEVQTLQGSTIWEVKIDRNGAIIEKEDATNDTED